MVLPEASPDDQSAAVPQARLQELADQNRWHCHAGVLSSEGMISLGLLPADAQARGPELPGSK